MARLSAADCSNAATRGDRVIGSSRSVRTGDTGVAPAPWRIDDPSDGAIVQVRDLRREYQMGDEVVRALRGLSLDIGHNEYVAVVGPSGCGKSTLLNILGVIDQPTAGTVRFRGRDVSTLRDHDATLFRLHNIGFVFQRFYLLPTLTARENIELPLAEAGVRGAARVARAHELLAYVGLSARERHRPAQLSGGEQQRVAIARALANRPAMLLADEPTGELDAQTGADVIELFHQLHADGTTLVVVTHDEHLAAAARRIIHMRDGVVVEQPDAGTRRSAC
jgi:putative ABC transport system ATP-binding protein